MQKFTVYRMDYVRNSRVPLGSVVERRKRNRPYNFLGLLKVARKTFGYSPNYDMRIVLDKMALKGPERRV